MKASGRASSSTACQAPPRLPCRRWKHSDRAAEHIFAVVESLIAADLPKETHNHAIALTSVACLMSSAGKGDLIASVLGLPVPARAKQRLLKVLVTMGEVIGADSIMHGFNELLEEAKTQRWLLDENAGYLAEWLELFPFSDRPAALFDALERVEPHLRTPWRLRRVFVALGCATLADAERRLAELARRDPECRFQHEWLKALEDLGTVEAGNVLLQNLGAMVTDDKNTRTIADALGKIMQRQPDFRRGLYDRYASLPQGREKNVVARAITEEPDCDGLLLLVRGYEAEGRNFYQTTLYDALRNLLTGHRDSSHFKGMQEIFSLPVAEVRQRLFRLMAAQETGSELACECLAAIDELREHYGTVDAEPRHPDIASGIAWPRITKWRRDKPINSNTAPILTSFPIEKESSTLLF